MKKKYLRTQFFLVSIGFLLIILTYFYYPSIKENKISKEQPVIEDFENINQKDQTTSSFENLEYKGLYDLNKPFTVKSEKAYILEEEPSIVYMQNMYVILYLNDDRIIEITSLKGHYNKTSYDCYFEEDVVATDGETTITAKNLDLLATKNIMQAYNEVILKNTISSLQADKVDYDFDTKDFKISMYNDESIKIKLIQ
tara:strand:- start:177 stop:770 length:594 start_codon:yes stop_codon:yes gene_type:complete